MSRIGIYIPVASIVALSFGEFSECPKFLLLTNSHWSLWQMFIVRWQTKTSEQHKPERTMNSTLNTTIFIHARNSRNREKGGFVFIIVGNINAITYPQAFPLIMADKMWLGVTIHSGDREFDLDNIYRETL